jgi:hypothetical protein
MRGIQDACEQRDLRWVLSKHYLVPCIAAGVGGGRSIGRGISTRARLTECVVDRSSTAKARAAYTPRARPAVQGAVSRAEAEGGARHTLYAVRSDARARQPSARRSSCPPSRFTTPTRSSALLVPVAATPPGLRQRRLGPAISCVTRHAMTERSARYKAHASSAYADVDDGGQTAQASSDDREKTSRRRGG